MLSFEIKGGIEAADRMISRLTLPLAAPSLGGVESLVTRPTTTSHASLSAEELRRCNIPEDLIRLSVGIEDADDLIEDLSQALG